MPDRKSLHHGAGKYTWSIRTLRAHSLVALHLLAAMGESTVLVPVGLMARELGGGRSAQGLTVLATFVAPNFLVFGT